MTHFVIGLDVMLGTAVKFARYLEPTSIQQFVDYLQSCCFTKHLFKQSAIVCHQLSAFVIHLLAAAAP